MRARVRKDASMLTVQKREASVPWVIRAAATLPRGVRVSNPLLGEDPAGTVAVIDNAASPQLSLPELFAIAKNADGALVVWDDQPHARAALLEQGFTTFAIDGCEQLFAANYPLPSAPWMRKVAESATPETTALEVSPEVGELQPEQGPKFRRVQSRADVIVDAVTLLNKSAHVIKNDDGEDERFILGVVLEPDEVDSQGDTISAEEIRRAAHRYMEEHANVGLQHQVFVNGKIKILESYVAPVAFTIGEEIVKAGTWLMAFRVLDDSIWAAVKDGLLTGLSIGGTGLKIPVA